MGDDESILEGTLQRDAGEDAGRYAIDLGTLSAGKNYTISFTGNDFAITPATLTVRAESGQGKVYGGEDPELRYAVEGLALGDDESIFTGVLERSPGEDVGTYAINLGTLSAGKNYEIAFVGNDFVIAPKELTVEVVSMPIIEKVYDGKNTAALDAENYILWGIANRDDVKVVGMAEYE